MRGWVGGGVCVWVWVGGGVRVRLCLCVHVASLSEGGLWLGCLMQSLFRSADLCSVSVLLLSRTHLIHT